MATTPDLIAVHDVHMAINLAHRFVYFVPEAGAEYEALGFAGRGSYFASRAAPLGAVPPAVILATFYNFSPAAVYSAVPGIWEAATPAAWQAARFRAAEAALRRVGVALDADAVVEARALLDPVVAGADLAGKPLAAGNAALDLPDDPLTALWQQVTVLREWRGDAHIAVLQANEVDPCSCMVLQVGSGRFPLAVTKASRQWTDEEWAAAVDRLGARGWVAADGTLTATGAAERERIEAETDRLCAPLWIGRSEDELRRVVELITPIHAAMDAAGTFAALR